MADPLGTLEKIVKLALRIKEAVDTVRQNKEACQQIRTQVLRISAILSHEPETRISGGPAICNALDDLEDALRRAHTIVTACCQDTSTLCLYYTARKQAKKLRRAQYDIGQKMMVVMFAMHFRTTSIILTSIRIQDVVPARVAQAAEEIIPEALEPPFELDRASFPIASPTTLTPPHPPQSDLSTIVRNEVTKQGLRLAAKVVEHSLFTSDSDSSVHQTIMSSPGSCTKMQETDATDISQSTTPSHSDQGLRKFSFSELETATHHFSVENMVGSGAFATVYKGVLHDGLVVAVKKIQYPDVLAAGNINDQLHLISNLKHKNIVKLIGYSVEILETAKGFEDTKVGAKENKEASYLLVEEYMPNGNLDKSIRRLGLYWPSRFHIIQGIGHGLCYLHEQDVIHLDVKPSNILLDYDMNPKITDFGIAKVLNHKGADICSDNGTIEGTLGYMPPEYITDGTLSKKHDVYGFGVTLLEIISGMSRSERAIGQASIEWAWEARQAGKMMELLDPSLFDAVQVKEIERCVEVALLCTQFDPADRPDMVEALEMLRGGKELRSSGYTKQPAGSWFGRWR